MQTCSSLLEPKYSGRQMHQPASFHYRQWRIKSLDRRPHSLPSNPYGLGLEHHQGPENNVDRHISARVIVRLGTSSS